MRNNQIAALYIAVTIIGFASPPAAAGDGQFEINQACAVNSGCFPGDTPGFPVTISFSGSFLLTGNLDLSALSPDLTAVEVSAPAVTVDLGGFQIVGPGGCTGSGSSISCPLGGLGRGVRAVDPAAIAFTLRNGVVRNMTGFGVSTAGSAARIENVTAIGNNIGIIVREDSLVSHCLAIRNGQDGISADMASIIESSVAEGNGGAGFDLENAAGMVTRSVARGNVRGFELAPGAEFGHDNVSSGNDNPDDCGGGICTELRRFYLKHFTDLASGSGALTVCAAGFHMASLFELWDLTVLRYDPVLGQTNPDSGLGPPSSNSGWVRTGFSSTGDSTPGFGNCLGWSTGDPTKFGSRARLPTTWDTAPSTRVVPWLVDADNCSNSSYVWCVEDD